MLRPRRDTAQRLASSDCSLNRKLFEGDAGCDSLTFIARNHTPALRAVQGIANRKAGQPYCPAFLPSRIDLARYPATFFAILSEWPSLRPASCNPSYMSPEQAKMSELGTRRSLDWEAAS